MFGGLGSLMSLLGNPEKLKNEMAKFQEQVGRLTAEGTAGGGVVTVKVNGRFEMLGCTLSADAAKLYDKEMVEDLIVAATNQAMAKVRELLAAESAKMAGNLGLPPGMLGGLPGLG